MTVNKGLWLAFTVVIGEGPEKDVKAAPTFDFDAIKRIATALD
jgi:hypothetical protein